MSYLLLIFLRIAKNTKRVLGSLEVNFDFNEFYISKEVKLLMLVSYVYNRYYMIRTILVLFSFTRQKKHQ